LNIPGCPIYVDPDTADHPVFNRPNAIDLGLRPWNENTIAAADRPLGFMLSDSDAWMVGWQGQRSEWTATNFGSIGYAPGDWENSRYVGIFWGRDLERTTFRLRPGVHGTAVGDRGGNYTYVSLLILNHFENLTIGAFQLMANILSMGYKETVSGELGWGNTPAGMQFIASTNPAMAELEPFSLEDYMLLCGDEELEEILEDEVVEEEAFEDYRRKSPASSDINAWLGALDKVLVNGMEAGVAINASAGTITIDKNDPALYVSPGASKIITVIFVAPGYEDVVMSNIRVFGEPIAVNAGTTPLDFISITETTRNSRVWALTFNATVAFGCREGYIAGTEIVEYTVFLNGNNANLDGRFTFDTGHDLAGFTLTYDIKGNGSNIKALSIR